MKKLLVLSLLSLGMAQAQAQVTSSGVMNSTGSIGSAQVNVPSTGLNTQSYNVTGTNGVTQSIMSPISNVYIQTPSSLQNLATSGANGTTATGNAGTVTIDPAANQKPKNNPPVTAQATPASGASAASAPVANANPNQVKVQPVAQTQASKPVGQTLERLPDITTNDIAGFNNTTIEQYEDQGEKQAEAEYAKFLKSR